MKRSNPFFAFIAAMLMMTLILGFNPISGQGVDRSAGNWKHELPLTSLLQMDLVTYTNETCPMCAQGLELVKPGSRPKP